MQNSYNGENPFEIILFSSIFAFTYYTIKRNNDWKIEGRIFCAFTHIIWSQRPSTGWPFCAQYNLYICDFITWILCECASQQIFQEVKTNSKSFICCHCKWPHAYSCFALRTEVFMALVHGRDHRSYASFRNLERRKIKRKLIWIRFSDLHSC